MNENNFNKKDNNIGQEHKEFSLEELDLLGRKCHHFHDEELLMMVSQFFHKLEELFNHGGHHHGHPIAR
jgi:hypothetical protein